MESTIYESFTLPSKGKVYSKPIDPVITLRSMTTMEEMKRLSPTETPYKVMSDIIEDCMKEKPAIHVYDMCLGDYQFLLHKLRIITYGTEYKMQIACPNCGKLVEAVGDLSSLEINEWQDTYLDLMNITLPVSNNSIQLRLQTPKDLDLIAYKNKEMRKSTKVNIDYSLLFTIVSMIKQVNGRNYNAFELEEFVKHLPMKDVNYIIKYSSELARKVGLDTQISAKCSQCGYELVTTFCIGPEFYGPQI